MILNVDSNKETTTIKCEVCGQKVERLTQSGAELEWNRRQIKYGKDFDEAFSQVFAGNTQ